MEYITLFENTSLEKIQEEDGPLVLSPGIKGVITALIAFFIVFTTAGNFLTIFVILTNKRLRSISNIYLASLACADMVVGSFVMLFMLLFTVSHNNVWLFGDAVCRIWTFVDYTCCSASLTNVCLIARDRYRSVSQPLKSIRKRTKKGAMYSILLAWMIPLVFWSTTITFLAVTDDTPSDQNCEVKWKPTFIVLTSAVAMIYVPIATIIIFFGAMMTFLHNHMNSMNFDLQRTESVRRQQSFASVMSDDATSEKGGGISFNPKCSSIEATHPLIEPGNVLHKASLARFSHGSTESADTTSTDYSAEVLSHFHDTCRRVRSVGTNTSPEKYGLVRSVGTNTSPVLRSNNSRASLASAMSDTRVIIQEGSCRRMFRRLKSDGKFETDVDSSDNEFSLSKFRRKKSRSHSLKSDFNSQVSRLSLDAGGRWNRYASVMRAERQNSVEKSRLKQQVSAAKTLGLIMGFLLLCWIPFSILCPLKAYWPDAIPRSAYQVSIWVNYMNSAINPIIYCLCNPQFRHAYSQMLRRRKGK